jgi:hypothetical protein
MKIVDRRSLMEDHRLWSIVHGQSFIEDHFLIHNLESTLESQEA